MSEKLSMEPTREEQIKVLLDALYGIDPMKFYEVFGEDSEKPQIIRDLSSADAIADAKAKIVNLPEWSDRQDEVLIALELARNEADFNKIIAIFAIPQNFDQMMTQFKRQKSLFDALPDLRKAFRSALLVEGASLSEEGFSEMETLNAMSRNDRFPAISNLDYEGKLFNLIKQYLF